MKLICIAISVLFHLSIFFKLGNNIKKIPIPTQPNSSIIRVQIIPMENISIPTLIKHAKPTSQSSKQKVINSHNNMIVSKTYSLKGIKILPIYPWKSKILKEEGIVKIAFVIHPDGKITNINITKSSGYQRLDRSAINSLKQLETMNIFFNQPTSKLITINFKLN